MQPFTKHTGLVVPMDRSDVDTDQIIPKQFLKRIERTGFGQFLFYDWRFDATGKVPNPEFELNLPEYEGASILLTRKNFGCGSSREHAPWALSDFGIRAIIAPSFADIFYNNAFKNGLLLVQLPEEQIDELFALESARRPWQLTVDLESGVIEDGETLSIEFEIEFFIKHCLIHGLDDIDLTLQYADKITEYERKRGII
ncbi:MAG: 3-isopropylmalate dehydratase small subunit [Planctomycetaceae bacterium]|nr:3-isopropylmalate dehydratase small subunit [Planctomycetaceae bacterium]